MMKSEETSSKWNFPSPYVTAAFYPSKHTHLPNQHSILIDIGTDSAQPTHCFSNNGLGLAGPTPSGDTLGWTYISPRAALRTLL